jgi:Kef-type K+ transport system membrane component KefB
VDNRGLETLLAVSAVAAVAPAIVSALPRPRPPQVVVLIFAGIIIGPAVLGLGDTRGIRLLSNVGLGFLFLLAGYELDLSLFRQHAGKLAIGGWLISAVLAVGAVGGLESVGFVRDYVPIALALTTTALGTLLPILKDNDLLAGRFGRYVLAAGAVGELFPIAAISLFLTKRGELGATISILVVCAAGFAFAAMPHFIGDTRLKALIKQGQRATAQTTLRWSIVLLLVLLVLAERFGLDVVLGALIAGIVLRSWTRRMGVDVEPLEAKLDAVGYGFFIPLFFVSSGMTLDVASIARNPLRLLVFLALLLAVRGLPALFVYRKVLPLRQRLEMTFITATTMPLLIALAEIGLSDGVMIPANAAALVGAGVASVLIYPLVAISLDRKASEARQSSEPVPPPELLRLPQARDSLADTDAHGRRRLAAAAPLQLVQQRRDDPGPRAPERVPDGDRAAVHVHQLGVALELVDDRDRLGGERLVGLEQRQVADRPA